MLFGQQKMNSSLLLRYLLQLGEHKNEQMVLTNMLLFCFITVIIVQSKEAHWRHRPPEQQ